MKRYSKSLTQQKKLFEEHASYLVKRLVSLYDKSNKVRSLAYKSELYEQMRELRQDLACIEEPLLRQHPQLQDLFNLFEEK